MSFKLLFPTYLARYRWVERTLASRTGGTSVRRLLHLGTGEGDYDPMLARFAEEVHAIDINPDDVAFARSRNAMVEGLRYSVQDGHALEFDDATFDAVVSVDVLEHVADPPRMLRELARVLRPGGFAVITVPNVDFPWTYDPLHRALSPDKRLAGVGAYAYGHDKLIGERQMRAWLASAGLEVEPAARITFALAASLECYWPGILQRVLKANATNDGRAPARRVAIKPRSHRVPALARVTEALNELDARIAGPHAPSVGIAFVARR
ncbi:class I SAM-dependent methyltransferase [Sandaracinus amylolyticus]|uniref:Methyltransferase type 11 n=1 Tax=Sandaracinus amylolyticus TaxID=927083 RepID=A0A0F6W1P3_9BACT|nr:class I SAM-dependent methyltransferase [Sandaracinus amylolyticus]AKF05237.1 Methyltransferase type 11 [Sandaracinus amylolyticus]